MCIEPTVQLHALMVCFLMCFCEQPNQEECKPVTVCSSQEYEFRAPSANRDRVCRTCDLGKTYLDKVRRLGGETTVRLCI